MCCRWMQHAQSLSGRRSKSPLSVPHAHCAAAPAFCNSLCSPSCEAAPFMQTCPLLLFPTNELLACSLHTQYGLDILPDLLSFQSHVACCSSSSRSLNRSFHSLCRRHIAISLGGQYLHSVLSLRSSSTAGLASVTHLLPSDVYQTCCICHAGIKSKVSMKDWYGVCDTELGCKHGAL